MDKLQITFRQVAQLMLTSSVMVDAVFNPEIKPDFTLSIDDLLEANRQMLLEAVRMIYEDEIQSPSELHENWLNDRQADGWTYGAQLSRSAKTSPLLMPWDDLTPMQRVKSVVSYSIASASAMMMDMDSFGPIEVIG